MRFFALALLALGPACVLGPAGGGVVGAGSGAFRENETKKELALTLTAEPARFRLPVRVSPASFDAHLDLEVSAADRALRLELAPEAFASADVEDWFLVDVADVVQAFSGGEEDEVFRVSLAQDPADVAEPLAVRLRFRLFAPADVDFDGVDDDTTVELGALAPIP